MDKNTNAMGTKKIMPLLISMSVPPMISMLIQALYNIVDSMYVARVSEDALTAVSPGISFAEYDFGSILWIWYWFKCMCFQSIGRKR